MKDDGESRRWLLRWALPVSVVVHGAAVVLLIYGLPPTLPLPEPEQAIAVHLTPPDPPEAKPAPAKPAEPDKAEKMPEVAEPEKPQQQVAEKTGQQPSESEKPEEAVDKPPPPKSEESKEAAATPQPPPPAPPSPPPPPLPQQPPPKDEALQRQASAMLKPVFQFGEKDAGPREAADGDSAEDGSVLPTPPVDPDVPDSAPPPAEATVEAEPPVEAKTLGPEPTKALETKPDAVAAPDAKPDPAAAPDAKPTNAETGVADAKLRELTATASDPDGPSASEQATTPKVAIVDPQPAPVRDEEPSPQPPMAPKAPPTPQKPRETKKLKSLPATDGPVATTAMNDLPRGVRGGRLCVTELRDQLRRAAPPYFPDLLPSYRLPSGVVLEERDAAFRMGGQWYGLGFRCEVDAGATKVVSFGFQVGAALPRGEWKRRGLPAQ